MAHAKAINLHVSCYTSNMKEINVYIKLQNKEQQDELQRIRNIVMQATPAAKEVMSYGMPAFKYRNKLLLCYAAQKHHFGIYPSSWPIEYLHKELEQYDTSKGSIRYTKENLIPAGLLAKIIQVRMKQIDADNKKVDK